MANRLQSSHHGRIHPCGYLAYFPVYRHPTLSLGLSYGARKDSLSPACSQSCSSHGAIYASPSGRYPVSQLTRCSGRLKLGGFPLWPRWAVPSGVIRIWGNQSGLSNHIVFQSVTFRDRYTRGRWHGCTRLAHGIWLSQWACHSLFCEYI